MSGSDGYRGPPVLDLTPEETEKCAALGFQCVAHDPAPHERTLPRNILTPGILAALRKQWAQSPAYQDAPVGLALLQARLKVAAHRHLPNCEDIRSDGEATWGCAPSCPVLEAALGKGMQEA